MSAALTVSVYSPWAVVSADRPPISYSVVPETRLSETPPLIRLGPPSSVSVKAPAVRLLVLIGSLKVTSMDETSELRGLGETGAIEADGQGGWMIHR